MCWFYYYKVMDTMESIFHAHYNYNEIDYLPKLPYDIKDPNHLKRNAHNESMKRKINHKRFNTNDDSESEEQSSDTPSENVERNSTDIPPIIPLKQNSDELQEEKVVENKGVETDSFGSEIIAKRNLLDPLTVIIKLAILSNKPVGTKVLIKNGIIHIQDPGFFQAITRYVYKTTRNDLMYLYNPIQIACKQYLYREVHTQNPKMVELFLSAQYGLLQLMETYRGNNVIHLCLNYYHSLIENSVKQIYSSAIFRDDDLTPFYTDELVQKLNAIWTSEKQKMILDMIHFLNDDNMAKENVKSLDIFIQNVDKQTQIILEAES
jgi:hypothetical protein